MLTYTCMCTCVTESNTQVHCGVDLHACGLAHLYIYGLAHCGCINKMIFDTTVGSISASATMAPITVKIPIDPFLVSAIIGRNGDGTRHVIRVCPGNGRKFVKCVREDGLAYLTAEEDVIDELVEVFESHVKSLTSVFYVKIHQGVVGRFLARGEIMRALRNDCCGNRYCRITYTPFPHSVIGGLECKCLVEDAHALYDGVTLCVDYLHKQENVEIVHYKSYALDFFPPFPGHL